MKKIILPLLFVALLAGCSAQKKLAKEQAAQQAEIEQLEHEARVRDLKHQQEIAELKYQDELDRLNEQMKMKEKSEKGDQLILTFCIDEAMDRPGEYMGGLGIAQNQLDQKDALIAANQVALSDINSRFIGVVKNGIEMYNKETNTRSREKSKESQLEGLAMSVGEKAINKFANVACRKIASEKEGTYKAWVAVHVPIKEVLDEIANELEVLQVDYDKKLFMDRMNEQLNAQAAKQNQEIEKLANQMNQ